MSKTKHTEGKADFRKAAFNTIDIVVGTKGIGRLGIFSSTNEEEDEANAARLVKAWNMHDELIEALKGMVHEFWQGYEEEDKLPFKKQYPEHPILISEKLIQQSEQ